MTTLSIICAFRDARHFLPTLLGSLDRARLEDWELILVDDSSRDYPRKVIDGFADRWGNVQLVRLDESRGPASARNRGMERSTGEFLAFVDADDWVGPNYFADMLQTMRRTGADFGRTNQTRVTGTERVIHCPDDFRYDIALDPRSAILPNDRSTMVDFPYSHSGIFHRRLLDRGLLPMPEGLWTAEDRPWIWSLHLFADSYVRIPTNEYFYRRGVSSSLTQIGDERQLDFIPSFTQVLELLLGDPDLSIYLPKASRQTLAVVNHHLAEIKRLEPGLRARMLEQLPGLVAMIPAEHLSEQLRSLGVRRADRLRRYLPELHEL